MPFSIAHPAIVIPIKKKIFKNACFTGLVIGSVVPDFEYFIRFKAQSLISHTIPGIFYFNLPLTFILAFLFHKIVRNPFLKNLPDPIDRWYSHYINYNLKLSSIRDYLVFIISSLIGIVSHLVWDSFTHKEGYFVKSMGFLNHSFSLFGSEIKIYKVLQHGSTIAGLFFLSLYFYLKRKENPFHLAISKKPKLIYWGLIFILTCFIFFSVILIKNYGFYFSKYGLYICILQYIPRDFKINHI